MTERIKNVEIVCNLKYMDKNTEKEKTFDIKEAEAILLKKLTAGSIIQYVYCVHNKDTYTKEEEEKNPNHKEGTKKADHIHIFIKLKEGRSFKDIGQWFGLESNFVNKCKSQFDNACLYAIHANAPDKYQYSIEVAFASPGFDYASLVQEKKAKYKREKNKDKAYQRKMEIVNLIEQGIINQINLSQYISAEEEVNFNNAIKIAFERKQREQALITERTMEGIYICGASGTAKTTLAKMIAYSQGFTFGISGSNRDPAQEYKNQECYILDDVSPLSFSWKEFLKLADNNTVSPVENTGNMNIFGDTNSINSVDNTTNMNSLNPTVNQSTNDSNITDNNTVSSVENTGSINIFGDTNSTKSVQSVNENMNHVQFDENLKNVNIDDRKER